MLVLCVDADQVIKITFIVLLEEHSGAEVGQSWCSVNQKFIVELFVVSDINCRTWMLSQMCNCSSPVREPPFALPLCDRPDCQSLICLAISIYLLEVLSFLTPVLYVVGVSSVCVLCTDRD